MLKTEQQFFQLFTNLSLSILFMRTYNEWFPRVKSLAHSLHRYNNKFAGCTHTQFTSMAFFPPLKIDFELYIFFSYSVSIRTLKIHKENNCLAVRGPCLFHCCFFLFRIVILIKYVYVFFVYYWLLRFGYSIRLLTVSSTVYFSQFDVFQFITQAIQADTLWC